jgi:DNA-directed RNA polymerase specialized sigma24 family protein
MQQRDVTTTDRTLMEAFLSGDSDAFRLLVERHQPSLLNYACGFLADQEAARAVVRRALWVGFRQLPRLRRNSLLSSFLIGILRGELKRRGISKAPNDVRPLWAGLAGLPRVQREVIVLHFQGMALRDIAHTRHESPSQTRARFANGLGHVAKKFSGAAPGDAIPEGCLAREDIFLGLAGALGAEEERRIEEHVAQCEFCGQRHENARRLFDCLREEIRPLLEEPPLLTQIPGPSFLSTAVAAAVITGVGLLAFVLLRDALRALP